jgi:hypothetical protein
MFEGEYQLIVYCAWRFDADDRVVCGSGDRNEEGAEMLTGLQQLIGREVESTSLVEPGLDLTVTFGSNLQLKVFCDETNSMEDEDNYVFRDNDDIYAVGPRGRTAVEAVQPGSPRSPHAG